MAAQKFFYLKKDESAQMPFLFNQSGKQFRLFRVREIRQLIFRFLVIHDRD